MEQVKVWRFWIQGELHVLLHMLHCSPRLYSFVPIAYTRQPRSITPKLIIRTSGQGGGTGSALLPVRVYCGHANLRVQSCWCTIPWVFAEPLVLGVSPIQFGSIVDGAVDSVLATLSGASLTHRSISQSCAPQLQPFRLIDHSPSAWYASTTFKRKSRLGYLRKLSPLYQNA